MRKYALFLVLFALPPALADVGIGVILGSPTGLSAKFGLSQDRAIDAAMAWDLNDDHFHFHGDYVFTDTPPIRLEKFSLDWYYGIGGRLVLLDNNENNRNNNDDDYKLGVRAPIGVSYLFAKPKIELFAELALILNLLESTDVDIDGGLGGRFHF